MAAYQSFPDRPGDSRSSVKLKRLQLPKSLAGKSVLDLGCNEGFFCIEAKQRGADYVLGVDRSAPAISAASKRAADLGLSVEFKVANITQLPLRRSFDFVLLLSALHYIRNPPALLQKISRHLAADGKLILECGVYPGSEMTVGRAIRAIDDTFFPTESLLRKVWLSDYAVKPLGRSVNQGGDPIPRFVFRCVKRVPTLILVTGEPGDGKTTFASQFEGSVTLHLDAIVSHPQRFHVGRIAPQQIAFDDAKVKSNGSIRGAWKLVSGNPEVVTFFAERVVRAIQLTQPAPLVVVEGYVLSEIVPEIKRILGSDYKYWIASKGSPSPTA